ncbi:MAG: flagellar motor protein MotB [Planctomycetota bacterium]|jgi:chemotaxis protein MotB
MVSETRQQEDDEPKGAPEWMVTFSDCMTLLLTFFVLLLSFSSFDENNFHNLQVVFSGAFPSVSQSVEKDKDAFMATFQIVHTEVLAEGSEKATLATGYEDNLKEDTEPADFHRRKVFLIPSRKIFWGKGTVISTDGRSTLSTLASFLKEVKGRIVISENGAENNKDSRDLGLERAWAVMDHLTSQLGLEKGWFSITAASTRAAESFESDKFVEPAQEAERTLEIVVLERIIYN